MAPRRGPVGLLAKTAEAAGVRGSLLALAAAALLCLAGCGGGGDSSTADGQGEATAQAEATGPGEAAKQDKGSEGKPSAGSSGAKQNSKSKQGAKAPLPAGEREPGITPQQRKKATTASMTLESPAFKSGTAIPTRFTCEGKGVSPPLRWQGVPAGSGELVLLALNLLPVEGALFFDWALAGLDPSLTGLGEGELPQGAVPGANGFGKRSYGLCPPAKDKETKYIFMLYAIPKALSPRPGFDPLALREEVLAEHGDVGLLATSYARH